MNTKERIQAYKDCIASRKRLIQDLENEIAEYEKKLNYAETELKLEEMFYNYCAYVEKYGEEPKPIK